MNIFEFYESILKFGGMAVDSEGYVKTELNGTPLQVLIDGKSLVLPTREHLATLTETQPNGTVKPVKVAFHPLRENVIRGESADLTKLREAISMRMNATLITLFDWLLRVANDPKLQKRKNKDLVDFMTSLGKASAKAQRKIVDDKTFKAFNQLVDRGMKDPSKFIIKIFIKRGGLIGKERYNRVCKVSFPLYKDILNAEKRVVHGVKLRIVDEAVFKNIYQFIFKDLDDETAYMFGSRNEFSPGLDSLLTAASNIAARLNKLVKSFKYVEKGADLDLLMFNLDWIDYIENLDSHKAEIMAIPSHNQAPVNDKQEETAGHSTGTISPSELSQHHYPTQQPVQPEPQPARTGRGVDPRSFVNNMPMGGYPMGQMPTAMAGGNMYPQPIPPGYYQQPQQPYPQNQPHVVPGFVNNGI